MCALLLMIFPSAFTITRASGMDPRNRSSFSCAFPRLCIARNAHPPNAKTNAVASTLPARLTIVTRPARAANAVCCWSSCARWLFSRVLNAVRICSISVFPSSVSFRWLTPRKRFLLPRSTMSFITFTCLAITGSISVTACRAPASSRNRTFSSSTSGGTPLAAVKNGSRCDCFPEIAKLRAALSTSLKLAEISPSFCNTSRV